MTVESRKKSCRSIGSVLIKRSIELIVVGSVVVVVVVEALNKII